MATFNWQQAAEYDENLQLIKSREEYVCDSTDDIAAIDTRKLLAGSLAFCPSTGTIYSLSDGTWYNVKDPTDTISGGGGGDLTITLDPSAIAIDLEQEYRRQVYINVNGTMPAGASLKARILDNGYTPYATVSDIMRDADDEPYYVYVNVSAVGEGNALNVSIEDDKEYVYAEVNAPITVTNSGGEA